MTYKCEHCGSQVVFAKVCAKCGRDHSEEWLTENGKTENIVNIGATCGTIYFFIAGLIVLLTNESGTGNLERLGIELGRAFVVGIIFMIIATIITAISTSRK